MTDQETVEQVIQRAVQRMVDEAEPDAGAIVTGWVVSYETASVDLIRDGMNGGGNITPDGQSPSMSRGMAMNVVDFYSPSNWQIGHGGDE